jgi:hypothetical protein
VGIYYLVQAGVVVAAEDHTQALFDNRDVGSLFTTELL